MPTSNTKKVKPNRRKPKPELVEGLTALQQTFIAIMVADPKMNATQAVLKAGYKVKPSNASAFASNLMANPAVKAALDHALYKRLWKHEITAERVLREVACLAYSDPADLYAADGITPLHPCAMAPETRRAVKSVRVSYTESMDEVGNFNQVRNVEANLTDKTVPLQMLMKHLGIDGTSKIDANLSGQVGVQFDLGQVLLDLEKSRVVDADTFKVTEQQGESDETISKEAG